MELKREQLLRAYPDLPPEVQTRMDSTLLRLHTQGRRAPVSRLSLVLSALLVMLAATGAAAGVHFGVLDFLNERFGRAVLPEAQQLVQRPAAALELAHTRIALEEAVYDFGRLRLVYSVTPAAGIEVTEAALADEESALWQALRQDDVSLIGGDWLRINGEEMSMPGDSFGDYAADEERSAVICYVDIELGAWALAPQGSFEVSLPVTGPQGGSRTLDFTVQAEETAEVAVRLSAGAVQATVERFIASPMGTYVRLMLTRSSDADDAAYAQALDDWRDARLTDANGAVLAQAQSVMTIEEAEGQSLTLNFTFPPVDAQEMWFAPTAVHGDSVEPDMARAMGIRKGE